ncbi:11483_t:CDS:2, partial [Entrophospora sp. SA101]
KAFTVDTEVICYNYGKFSGSWKLKQASIEMLGLSNFYEERTSGFEAMQSFVRARDDPFAREVNSEKIKIASLLSHMLPLFYQQIKQG